MPELLVGQMLDLTITRSLAYTLRGDVATRESGAAMPAPEAHAVLAA